MSTNASFDQAGHTLKLIGDKKPTPQDIATLHDGYLSDLIEAIMNGSIQSREEFRKANGLPPREPTVVEKDGIIFITFTTNGMLGPEWKAHFKKRKFPLSSNAEKLLDDASFKASPAGTIRQVAILKGEIFPDDTDRITRKIRAKATELKFATPDMEQVCLIRANFTNKQINTWGLNWIVGMHDPVKIGGGPDLLTVCAYVDTPKLYTDYGRPDDIWDRGDGFAFDASQVALKA